MQDPDVDSPAGGFYLVIEHHGALILCLPRLLRILRLDLGQERWSRYSATDPVNAAAYAPTVTWAQSRPTPHPYTTVFRRTDAASRPRTIRSRADFSQRVAD